MDSSGMDDGDGGSWSDDEGYESEYGDHSHSGAIESHEPQQSDVNLPVPEPEPQEWIYRWIHCQSLVI